MTEEYRGPDGLTAAEREARWKRAGELRKKKGLRASGHRLQLEYNGEESSTGTCRCGWQEHASNQEEVRWEYRCHLAEVVADRELGRERESYGDHADEFWLDNK